MNPLSEKEKAQIRYAIKRMKLIVERRNQTRRDRFMRHSPKPSRYSELQEDPVNKAY